MVRAPPALVQAWLWQDACGLVFLFPPVLLRRPGPRRPPCGVNGHGRPMRPRNLTLLPVAPLHAYYLEALAIARHFAWDEVAHRVWAES